VEEEEEKWLDDGLVELALDEVLVAQEVALGEPHVYEAEVDQDSVVPQGAAELVVHEPPHAPGVSVEEEV